MKRYECRPHRNSRRHPNPAKGLGALVDLTRNQISLVIDFLDMEQAIERLEKDMAELALRQNSLRQEEITEEIEVIMLSAEVLKQP